MAYVASDSRVRRLYCLGCGEGSYAPLPATTFIETHTTKHDIEDHEVNEAFLVIERPEDDPTIKLDQYLRIMFKKDFLVWGGDPLPKRVDEYRKDEKGKLIPMHFNKPPKATSGKGGHD